MLDIQLLREKPDEVKVALSRRGVEVPIDHIIDLDAERRALLTEVETLKAERNRVSREISKIQEAGDREKRIQDMRRVGERIETIDAQVRRVDEALRRAMLEVPNLPDATVPDGPDDSANPVVREVGEAKVFDFEARPHWDLGSALGILDLERGVKLTGSRFYVLSGAGARLQRALIAWMLDLHIQQGYLEQYPPFMVRGEVVLAAGKLPKFEDDLYRDHEEDLWLVPTAEVPLTGLHIDEILDEASLPRRYTAYTPCFRREKFSAGRDVRGIKRGHQFDKVEMYTFCRPEESDVELERMVADAEATCTALGLAHRVKQLCTGDLGFTARKSYDVEVWAPGCGEWLEVSSVSNCGDFQTRRANARFRRGTKGRTEFLHTLNGSGLGLPRTWIAVVENFQQPDGSIVVPDVLRPWMGGVDVIGRDEG